MSSGYVSARTTVSSQGAFMGQFDTEMNNRQLIGGKTNLQQFDQFQHALSNATVKICRSNFTEDVQSVINDMEEVVMKELEMPDDTLLTDTLKAQIHISRYNDKDKRFNERKACYKSNKSRMCSVVLAQCDPAMEVKLQVTEGWEDNKTDLLFVLTAAQAACTGVQKNYSMYVMARDAMRSMTNCFHNNDTALAFKTRYFACKKQCDKAGIGFTFSKKFLVRRRRRTRSSMMLQQPRQRRTASSEQCGS